MSRIRTAVAYAAVAVVAAGLATVAMAERPESPEGVVTGSIIFVGGPAPPPGTHRTPQAGVVSVFRKGGHLVAREHVRAGHHFRFRLTVGRYLLSSSTQLHPKPPNCGPVSARVRADRTTRVDVPTGCGVP